MLELKKIFKTYKSKKGTKTEALKDISINFPNTGMIFILGKSGSGKSTLLNIIGGLDKYDKGDLVIEGKSTKKFKNSDYDAYRNTYIGFIFQDFNLLENYSIEKNVALSLELQNKEVDKKSIDEILSFVGLENIKRRKPNELSGGQKQRIAIARALIKNPNVILADEPTGNLDSATGRQIFDLLKELSKKKLIIIVTHDKENAYKYGDRIIELKDGEIYSDNNPLQAKENFGNSKLISAKLPFLYSLKMGLGNLFHKKIRLIFTVILTTFAIVCLGLMKSATSFDANNQLIDTMTKNKDYDVSIVKYDKKIDYEKIALNAFNFNLSEQEGLIPKSVTIDDETINKIENKTNLNWTKETKIVQNGLPIAINFIKQNSLDTLYYKDSIVLTFIDINEENHLSNIIGRMPVNDDEVVVSKFIADNIIESGTYSIDSNNKKEEYYPKSYNQLVSDSKYISIDNVKQFKIVGIDNTDMKDVEILKTTTWDDYGYSWDFEDAYSIYNSNLKKYSRIYTTTNYINYLSLKENNKIISTTKMIYNDNTYIVNQSAYIRDKIDAYDGNSIRSFDKLNNNQIIIDIDVLNNMTNGDYYKKLENYLNNNYNDVDYSKDTFTKKYIKDNNIISKTIKTGVTLDKIVRDKKKFISYEIVGVNFNAENLSTIYYSKEILNNIVPKNIEVYSIYTKTNNIEQLKNIFTNYPIDKSILVSTTKYSTGILNSTVYVYLIKMVGSYGSVFFLIFSIFLLMNFINTSVSFRKKEVGILRAIGCKSRDILKMFIVESFVLIMICLSLSYFTINTIANFFNNALSTFISNDVSFLVFGYKQFTYLTFIMFLIIFIANIIPIKKITSMKPIDIILNK